MVGRIAEQNLKEIENTLDYKLAGRIEILAYNKLSVLYPEDVNSSQVYCFS